MRSTICRLNKINSARKIKNVQSLKFSVLKKVMMNIQYLQVYIYIYKEGLMRCQTKMLISKDILVDLKPARVESIAKEG